MKVQRERLRLDIDTWGLMDLTYCGLIKWEGLLNILWAEVVGCSHLYSTAEDVKAQREKTNPPARGAMLTVIPNVCWSLSYREECAMVLVANLRLSL